VGSGYRYPGLPRHPYAHDLLPHTRQPDAGGDKVEVGPDSTGRSKGIFQVVGRSKIPLHLDHRGFLITIYESRPICCIREKAGFDPVVQQGSFKNYVEDISYLRMMLHKGGYEDTDTASVYVTVDDANGKVHEQPVIFTGLKDPDTTKVVALPFPWYKRWIRSFSHWRQVRRVQAS